MNHLCFMKQAQLYLLVVQLDDLIAVLLQVV